MAKKFKFRLAPVLKYREWIEDEARKRFIEIQQVRDQKLMDLEILRTQSSHAVEAMIDAE